MKDVLLTYLERGHAAVLWKVAGLSERDLRMPMTTSGTNLLGVVKHLALVESDYLGSCVGRPFPDPLPWDSEEVNADMWATADESAEQIVGFYREVARHSVAVVSELELDSPATVSWWTPQETTLGRLLVHMTAETARHAGHLDIIREELDGERGVHPAFPNILGPDEFSWAEYVDRLRAIAGSADQATPAVRNLPM